MPDKVRFGKKDIGADLLSILTTGLYRDTLDTLREYIQNGIDARSDAMTIKITPDTITITDNGHGMDEQTARQAIRLGISEKNPDKNVGFRGIGIYSAFNLCNLAEIYTKAEGEHERKLTFNFRNIRDELDRDQERRKTGLPLELYLEKVLQDSVYIEESTDGIISDNTGTKILFSGLLGEVYQRLNNWQEVTRYLQDVVPLPFRDDFKYKQDIEQKLLEAGEKIVKLFLTIGTKKDYLLRPYHDAMFTQLGTYPPKFLDIDPFGFAWICINDSRTVLGNKELRGLLIKKFGFSIANRSFLEPFFSRVVFNRRITGELVIQNPSLIPNAARSDFEHNSTREAFLRSLPKFINNISRWANDIQEEEKAKEVLYSIFEKLKEINTTLPEKRRNSDDMLILNVRLANLRDELRIHEKRLEKKYPTKLKEVKGLLQECLSFVASELAASRNKKVEREKRIARSIVTAAKVQAEENERSEPSLDSLSALLEAFGIPAEPDMKKIIEFIDNSILKEYLDEDHYHESLRQLRDYLGEKF